MTRLAGEGAVGDVARIRERVPVGMRQGGREPLEGSQEHERAVSTTGELHRHGDAHR